MLHLFEEYESLFSGWRIEQYEVSGNTYRLRITATLRDGSRLVARDYLLADGKRKYAYQWMEANGALRRRWDNAPHWPGISTAPHHVHIPAKVTPEGSTITNIEDLFAFLQETLNRTVQ